MSEAACKALICMNKAQAEEEEKRCWREACDSTWVFFQSQDVVPDDLDDRGVKEYFRLYEDCEYKLALSMLESMANV